MKDNWDPKPAERTYYRSRHDGQRAYLVRRDGVDQLRLDRPQEELLRKFTDAEWSPDDQTYPMTPHQAARVAFIADRALCGVIGAHTEARDEWLSQKERARIRFMERGPETGDIRDKLFGAIMGVLRELTNG